MVNNIVVTSTPDIHDLEFLARKLTTFNDADVGSSEKQDIAVFIHGDADAMIGGISGYTAWGWLYIQWLWVDEGHRGQKLAAKMLEAAENEALSRGCHGALIDSFSPIAVKAYERQGYQIFGTLPDFPIGRSRVYLQKKL